MNSTYFLNNQINQPIHFILLPIALTAMKSTYFQQQPNQPTTPFQALRCMAPPPHLAIDYPKQPGRQLSNASALVNEIVEEAAAAPGKLLRGLERLLAAGALGHGHVAVGCVVPGEPPAGARLAEHVGH